jgi:hypothetical protein
MEFSNIKEYYQLVDELHTATGNLKSVMDKLNSFSITIYPQGKDADSDLISQSFDEMNYSNK